MIIKKKRLNKLTGLGDMAAEQTDSSGAQYYSGEYSDEEDLQDQETVQENSSEGSHIFYHGDSSKETEVQKKDSEINLFDVDNIDFSQRQERRRGDRRRGFRRVDDRNLVSRAREEADAIRESALKEGYQAGLDQALADVSDFKNSLEQFMNAKQEVFEYIAPDILEISVDIAKKIIKKEIEQDPQVLFNTIVDVLKTLPKEESKVTLRVNPAEVNTVKQSAPELLNIAGLDAKIVVLSDEGISEGGCLVATTNGIVDATIETRIEVVSKALKEL